MAFLDDIKRAALQALQGVQLPSSSGPVPENFDVRQSQVNTDALSKVVGNLLPAGNFTPGQNVPPPSEVDPTNTANVAGRAYRGVVNDLLGIAGSPPPVVAGAIPSIANFVGGATGIGGQQPQQPQQAEQSVAPQPQQSTPIVKAAGDLSSRMTSQGQEKVDAEKAKRSKTIQNLLRVGVPLGALIAGLSSESALPGAAGFSQGFNEGFDVQKDEEVTILDEDGNVKDTIKVPVGSRVVKLSPKRRRGIDLAAEVRDIDEENSINEMRQLLNEGEIMVRRGDEIVAIRPGEVQPGDEKL